MADKFSLEDMIHHFDIKKIRLGGPVFDLTKLKWLNGEYLRKLTPEQFYAELRKTVLSDAYLSQHPPTHPNPHRNPRPVRRPHQLLLP